jgi:hypothetical protein
MMRVLQFVNLPSFYFTAVWLDSLVAVTNSASGISLVLTPTGFDKNFANIELKSGGKLTKAEKYRLNQRLNRNSRAIYHEKHD